MLKVFIGYDSNESVAYHTLSHSIMRHAKKPIAIIPLKIEQLPMTRPRDLNQSTEFSFSRFLVPWLCDYKGKAIFMDCDMIVKMDLNDLEKQSSNNNAAVSVIQHQYIPKTDSKFLDQRQSKYEKKNWSSVMLFNNELCKPLTPEIVNSESGMFLHQFEWAQSVGSIPVKYNHLVGEYPENPDAKIIHYTLGTPCFQKYANCEYADEWREEERLMSHHNKIGEFSLHEKEAA